MRSSRQSLLCASRAMRELEHRVHSLQNQATVVGTQGPLYKTCKKELDKPEGTKGISSQYHPLFTRPTLMSSDRLYVCFCSLSQVKNFLKSNQQTSIDKKIKKKNTKKQTFNSNKIHCIRFYKMHMLSTSS